MKGQKGYITYLILTAIAIVAVVSIVIPPLMEVTSDWTLTRAMDVLQDNGYSAFADTNGNFTVSGNMTVGGNLNVGGTMSGSFSETSTLDNVLARGSTSTKSMTIGGITLTNDLDAGNHDISSVDDLEVVSVTTSLGTGTPVAKGVNHLPYILVAAANSSTEARNAAQYVCDGAVDNNDEVNIQAAIDFMESLGGGNVVLSNGSFYISDAIDLGGKDNVGLIGHGVLGTRLLQTDHTSSIIVANIDTDYVTVEDIYMDYTDNTSTAHAMDLYFSSGGNYHSGWTLDNLFISDSGSSVYAIKLGSIKDWCVNNITGNNIGGFLQIKNDDSSGFDSGDSTFTRLMGSVNKANSVHSICITGSSTTGSIVNNIVFTGVLVHVASPGSLVANQYLVEGSRLQHLTFINTFLESTQTNPKLLHLSGYWEYDTIFQGLNVYAPNGTPTIAITQSSFTTFYTCNLGGAEISTGDSKSKLFINCVNYTTTGNVNEMRSTGWEIHSNITSSGTHTFTGNLLLNKSGTPNPASEGMLYYNATVNHFYGYNGAWIQLDN